MNYANINPNNRVRTFYVLIPFAAIVLASLACVVEQPLGLLSVEATPMPFTMFGEVDNSWQIKVNSNIQYVVTLTRRNSNHPTNQVNISILEDNLDISEAFSSTDNTAKITFTTSQDGQVKVVVYSKIGERQENLGTFSIQVQEVRP